jgi:hypothetical protein
MPQMSATTSLVGPVEKRILHILQGRAKEVFLVNDIGCKLLQLEWLRSLGSAVTTATFFISSTLTKTAATLHTHRLG